MVGLISVVMIFSIPLVAILTDHFQKQAKIQKEMLKDQLELERLKNENYLLETEKLRLELDQMRFKDSKEKLTT